MRLNLSVFILMMVIFCGIFLKVLFTTAGHIQNEVVTSFQLTNQLIDTELKYIRSHLSKSDSSSNDTNDLINLKQFNDVKYIDVELFDADDELISSSFSGQPHQELWLPERVEHELIFGLFDPIETVVRSITIAQKYHGKIVVSVDKKMKLHNLWIGTLTTLSPMMILFLISYFLITFVLSYVIRPLIELLRIVNQENISNVSQESHFSYLDSLPRRLQGIRNELMNSSQKVHDLNDRILHLQEDERRKLSAELHDELGQHLTAISFEVEVIKTAKNLEEAQHSAEAIDAIGRDMKNIVRSMLQRLRPPELELFGLKATITEMIADWGLSHPQCTIDYSCTADFSQLDESKQLNIYRIVQEGLTNISRHAGLTGLNITISLLPLNDQIKILIADDGHGCDLTQPSSGFGLNGMRERVQTCAGSITLNSSPNQGMKVEVLIPNKSEKKHE